MNPSVQHEFEASDPARLVARPEVSVGIITYNHERYLARAVESVLEQKTDFPFEIIIYEDCSTDRTREIALDFQRRHPETIRVLYSRANVGMGENVRRGIAACRGRYTAGCEGDDFWSDPLKLQKQFDALEAHPELNLCFTGGLVLNPDGSTERRWDYGSRARIVPVRELLRTPGMTAPTASLFYRAHVLHGTPDWIYGAPVMDIFHILAATHPNGAYYLPETTVTYRNMSVGSWSSQHADNYHAIKLDHSRRMIESYRQAAASFAIPMTYFRFSLSLPNYLLGRNAFSRGNYKAAFEHFRRVSFRYLGMQLRDLPRRFGRSR